MAIRSNDATRASNTNNRDYADPIQQDTSASAAASHGMGHENRSSSTNQIFAQRSSARSRLHRWITGAISAGALGLMLCSTTGCTTTAGIAGAFGDGHCMDDFMIGYRNKAMAEKAWHCQKDGFCNQKHSKEFKEGFCEGFIEVASGGNGCTPAVAPKQYWGWRYQSAQGQSAVNAWFEGYPMGVKAAEQLGVGHWGEVRTTGFAPAAVMNGAGPAGNPFYGSPAVQGMPISGGSIQGEVIQGPGTSFPGTPFEGVPSHSDAHVFEPASVNADSGGIEMQFDSVSLESGFGDEPVFSSAVEDEATSHEEERVASLPAAVETQLTDLIDSAIGDSDSEVDIDEVFGSGTSQGSAVGDDLPFSFE